MCPISLTATYTGKRQKKESGMINPDDKELIDGMISVPLPLPPRRYHRHPTQR